MCERVHVEDAGGARYSEGHVAPGRVAVAAGPARVYGGEGAVGEGAAFELQGQDGGIIRPSCSEECIYLRVDALQLDIEHPAEQVGEVDGVVHHRAAARELEVEEPTARDLTAVRAAYGQHATQGSAANDLPRAGHRGEVAYWKSRPEHAARVLGGLDHGPRVLDGGRDGLLAENVHTAL